MRKSVTAFGQSLCLRLQLACALVVHNFIDTPLLAIFGNENAKNT